MNLDLETFKSERILVFFALELLFWNGLEVFHMLRRIFSSNEINFLVDKIRLLLIYGQQLDILIHFLDTRSNLLFFLSHFMLKIFLLGFHIVFPPLENSFNVFRFQSQSLFELLSHLLRNDVAFLIFRNNLDFCLGFWHNFVRLIDVLKNLVFEHAELFLRLSKFTDLIG